MALPPTAAKFSTDVNNVTTFFFSFPNFTGTHSGVTASLGINSVAGGGTGLATLTANNVILGNGTSSPTFVAPGTAGNLLTSNGTTWISSPGGAGTGTVTSVALADGSSSPIFSITGSPVTTSGTLTETLIVQSANKIFAGPTSGSSAQPTFRSLVNADLPSGSSAFAAYASSQVTTLSSVITSGTFTTFSNSPAFTFVPTITGTYKVYCSLTGESSSATSIPVFRIFNTLGSAVLLQESQVIIQANINVNPTAQSVYTLTAGVTYVFDVQAKETGSGGAYLRGDLAPFYMFAEGIGLSGTFLQPVGNWNSNLTFTVSAGFGTPTSSSIFSRVVGDTLEVQGSFLSGTVSATTASIALPSGYVIDSTKLNTLTNGSIVGICLGGVSGTNTFGAITSSGVTDTIFYDGTDTANLYFTDLSGSNQFTKVTGSARFTTGQLVSFQFKVPIVALNGTSALASSWFSYTPTFTGMGTVSTQTFWYRIDGDSIHIKGTWTTGTPTATQAQISLPPGYTIQSSKVNGSNELCGYMTTGNQNNAAFTVLIQPSTTYLTFGFNNNGTGGVNPDLGSTVFASAIIYSFSTTAIPVS